MKSWKAEEIYEIQQACVSIEQGPLAVIDWMESLGLPKEEFVKVLEQARVATQLLRSVVGTNDNMLLALWCAGFELGVRFEQAREVVV